MVYDEEVLVGSQTQLHGGGTGGKSKIQRDPAQKSILMPQTQAHHWSSRLQVSTEISETITWFV